MINCRALLKIVWSVGTRRPVWIVRLGSMWILEIVQLVVLATARIALMQVHVLNAIMGMILTVSKIV